MDYKDIMQALASIHNRLCDVSVKGESAIQLSDCILRLRKLIDDLNKAPVEPMTE